MQTMDDILLEGCHPYLRKPSATNRGSTRNDGPWNVAGANGGDRRATAGIFCNFGESDEKMVIANPIYDTVFKNLMDNEKVARFFISTLLDENIESVEAKPQEYGYEGKWDSLSPEELKGFEESIRERLGIWVYRLDFIATIKTATGEYKKVLIEIQKAKNQIDVMRFRNYLAEQYKREDKINGKKAALPITTIYILGFKLPEIETACVKVERNYKDLVNKTIIEKKNDFLEKLTHDCFVVQVQRVTSKYQTRLDKLLSIFEQVNFADEKQLTKEFNHEADIEELKIITNILHYTGTNPEEKKKMEIEQEAWRTVEAMYEEWADRLRKELEENKKVIEDKDKALQDKDKALQDKDKALQDKDKALQDKDKALVEKDRLIEELLRKAK